MIIKLIPQIRENNKIWYDIEENKITVTINDVTDTFDFTGMPDGKLQLYDLEGEGTIETVLDEVPIIGAEKTDGVLTVEIIFSLDEFERDGRLLFPEPMSLDEFNELMDELVERKELEETDDLIEPDEVAEDEKVDGEGLVHKDDYTIDLEGVDF